MSALPRHSWLGPAAGFGGAGCLSLALAEGPVGVVPRHFWAGLAAGFAGVGCPSFLLVEGPVAAGPCVS